MPPSDPQRASRVWRINWPMVLLFSVGLNIVLLVVSLAPKPIAHVSAPAMTQVVPRSGMKEQVTDLPMPTQQAVVRWAQIASPNLTNYAAHLRSLACPEETVRVILGAEIRRATAPKLLELGWQQESDFWESATRTKRKQNAPRSAVHYEAKHQWEKLLQERARQLEEFGETDSMEWGERYPDDDGSVDVRDFLSEEKRALIATQEQMMDELPRRLRKEGLPESDVQRRVVELQADQIAERYRTFSRGEFEEFQLRSSRFAETRHQLFGFVPTAEEHRAMVRLQETHDGKVPKEEWSRLFGAERVADFERAQDGEFAHLYKIADRLELPESTAVSAFEIKRQAEEAVGRIRRDATLSSDEQRALLSEIQAETRRTLAEVMGDNAFDLYQKKGARWLEESFKGTD